MTTLSTTSEATGTLPAQDDERFLVMILPIDGVRDAAAIHVNGRIVGTIVRVEPEDEWVCFDGTTRSGGHRWLPAGLDPCTEGPTTCADATMLLLVLAGYDPQAVVRSLGSQAA